MKDPLTDLGESADGKPLIALTDYLAAMRRGEIYHEHICSLAKIKIEGNQAILDDGTSIDLTDELSTRELARVLHVPQDYAMRLPADLRLKCLEYGASVAEDEPYVFSFSHGQLMHVKKGKIELLSHYDALDIASRAMSGNGLLWDMSENSYIQRYDFIMRGKTIKVDGMTWIFGLRVILRYRKNFPLEYPILCCLDTSTVICCPHKCKQLKNIKFNHEQMVEFAHRTFDENTRQICASYNEIEQQVSRAQARTIKKPYEYLSKYAVGVGLSKEPVLNIKKALDMCEGEFTKWECIRLVASLAQRDIGRPNIHYSYEGFAGCMLMAHMASDGVETFIPD